MRGEFATHRRLSTLLLTGIMALGCASVLTPNLVHYRYFEEPEQGDPWSSKITAWQIRDRNGNARAAADLELGGAHSLDAVSGGLGGERGEGLRSKYEGFQIERKRRTAREFMEWIQAQASEHYISDGPVDHWATLEETLSGDGDDCDGLELLVFHALRDQGFEEHEIFRAVVHRPSDGQHHMVTLWFEQRDDPWVIDPTGAMTRRMVKMSELPQWAPLKVFSSTEEYSARAEPVARAPRLASNP